MYIILCVFARHRIIILSEGQFNAYAESKFHEEIGDLLQNIEKSRGSVDGGILGFLYARFESACNPQLSTK